jgi:hypothetical protein
MSQGEYAKYIKYLEMRNDLSNEIEVGKRTQHLLLDKTNFPETTHRFESYIVYAPGFGFHDGKRQTIVIHGEQIKDLPFSIPFDEMNLFIGTNTQDPTDLGGEVEFWLGEGEKAEKFLITKSSCVFVPAGLVHLPIYFRKVDRPFIFLVVVNSPDSPGTYMKFADVLPPKFSI